MIAPSPPGGMKLPKAAKIKKLPATAVGYPRFKLSTARSKSGDCSPFTLSSHERAREALNFGLSLDDSGFNIFVLGEESSGRMTSTLQFLESYIAEKPAPDDWVYLNNFRRPNEPLPFRLPAGKGRALYNDVNRIIVQLRAALKEAFQSDEFQSQIKSKSEQAQSGIAQKFSALQEEANQHGLELGRSPQGQMTIMRKSDQEPENNRQIIAPQPSAKPDVSDEQLVQIGQEISEKMAEIAKEANQRHTEFTAWVDEYTRNLGDQVIGPYLDTLDKTYGKYTGFARWLTEFRADLLDHLKLFFAEPSEAGEEGINPVNTPERRYAVNLFVEHDEGKQTGIVLEANPTYENLFGRIEYEPIDGALHTDYRMLQSGSLHRANGGILVVRAEALAADGYVWMALKRALRDREIRIEEIHRSVGVPLHVNVVIVGSPQWYYMFFTADPEFKAYFKIKADIDSVMDASPSNLACYATLIQNIALTFGDVNIKPDALMLLLGEAARIAGHREKLSARYEVIADIVRESLPLNAGPGRITLKREDVATTLANRRRRNARIEDRIQEVITEGLVNIVTTGTAIGQINALTVRDVGDHAFGAPARITARASVGRRGAINIERDVELGGPIQQKGMMVLQGYLAGQFAQSMPVSFDCSVTFEQSYGGVEGDSASMAELLAILSDLADAPLRQDLAITGSVDQFGKAQSIGGVTEKIEGFYRTCKDHGGLNGTQGVVVPATNASQIILREDIANAVRDKKFHIYAMQSVEDALALFTGMPVKTLYDRVMKQLEAYDQILAERNLKAD
jgi:predicted ATP-dependent protease